MKNALPPSETAFKSIPTDAVAAGEASTSEAATTMDTLLDGLDWIIDFFL